MGTYTHLAFAFPPRLVTCITCDSNPQLELARRIGVELREVDDRDHWAIYDVRGKKPLLLGYFREMH